LFARLVIGIVTLVAATAVAIGWLAVPPIAAAATTGFARNQPTIASHDRRPRAESNAGRGMAFLFELPSIDPLGDKHAA
jgi:hypothetical protein